MKLAIFDFDGTLFPQDTLPFLLKQWSEQKYSKKRLVAICFIIGGLYIRYKLGLNGKMSREMMKRTALQRFTRIYKGMTKAQVDLFFERCAHLIVAHLNKDVVQEVIRVKQQGYHTVILSGCYEDLLAYVGKALDIDTVLGTKMYFENDIVDVLTPMDIATGDEKVSKIKAHFKDVDVDLSASCAYADSYSDIAILELVGQPVVVNPDPELKDVLKDKDWRTIMTASNN